MKKNRLYVFLLFVFLSFILLACKELDEIPFIALKANFSPSKSIVQIGDTVLFIQQSDVGRNYAWDFGDGTSSKESDPKKVYNKTGLFTVKLTTTKDDGITKDTIIKQVRVLPPTIAGNDTLTFNDLSGNTSFNDEVGHTFARIDNELVLVGRKNLNTLYVVKTTLDLQKIWAKEYTNLTTGRVTVRDIRPTIDGGFVIVGYFAYSNAENDAFILRLDADGNERWRVINATGRDEIYHSVSQVNGFFVIGGTVGEFDVTGNKRTNLLLEVYSPTGVLEQIVQTGNNWALNNLFYTQSGDYAGALTEGDKPAFILYNPDLSEPRRAQLPFKGKGLGLTQLNEGGFILVGEKTLGSDSSAAFISKINQFGNIEWTNDSIAYYNEKFIDVVETSDGSLIALGEHSNPLTGKDILLMKYSKDGVLQKTRLVGAKKDDQAFKMRISRGVDENIFIIGSTRSFGGGVQYGLSNIIYLRINTDLE